MKYSVYVLSLMFFTFSLLFAQNKTQQKGARSSNVQTPQLDVDFQQLDKSSQQIIPQQQYLEQALGKAIDSTKYILGPGDQMLIKVWGPLENQFITEITPEGYLVIPTVTDVKIAGMTLADGTRLVKETLNKYFRNAGFSIRLVRLRKFRVYVVGEIANPGTYYLRSADRVSDAIELAGGLTQWGDDTRLQLRHSELPTDTVNINTFYLHGDLKQNPNLDGGDIIYIPPIDLAKNYVIVEGNVGSEGIYQFRESETLLSFLTRIRAINRRSDVNNVILIRDGKRKDYDLIKEEENVKSEPLMTGDRVIIPTNRDRVYVKGEVMQPGPFPYLANYTAKDYAGYAGLMDTGKSIKDIYVIHTENGHIEKGGSVLVQKGDIVVVPKRGREVFKDYMTILTPIISIGLSAYALMRTVQ